jgi:hypothetical protein
VPMTAAQNTAHPITEHQIVILNGRSSSNLLDIDVCNKLSEHLQFALDFEQRAVCSIFIERDSVWILGPVNFR